MTIVDILGRRYAVSVANENEEKRLTDCDGFCDETTAEIFAEDYGEKALDLRSKANLSVQTKKVLRHEIVHAFLFESGLAENSTWAQNEEIVDWFAIQGLKIYKAWNEVGAI